MRIWKQVIQVTNSQSIRAPEGSKILTVQMQNGNLCIWYQCDETAPCSFRTIDIYGTGNPIPDNPGRYISTFQMNDGALVFHVFERL